MLIRSEHALHVLHTVAHAHCRWPHALSAGASHTAHGLVGLHLGAHHGLAHETNELLVLLEAQLVYGEEQLLLLDTGPIIQLVSALGLHDEVLHHLLLLCFGRLRLVEHATLHNLVDHLQLQLLLCLEDLEALFARQQGHVAVGFLLDGHDGHHVLLRLAVVHRVRLELVLVNCKTVQDVHELLVRQILFCLHNLDHDLLVFFDVAVAKSFAPLS